MSEIARKENDVLEGVILDDAQPAPFASAEEAAKVMSDAFSLLREGRNTIVQGHAILEVAKAREAWKILGFDTFEECVLAGVEEHLRARIQPEYRRELTADLRNRWGLSTRAVGKRLGVSHMTTHRDLMKARAAGQLVDEGETVVCPDGSTRPARRTPPRQPFAKTWETQAHRLIKALAALDKLRDDDRWTKASPDLAVKWGSDLSRALDQYAALLEDLGTTGESES